MGALPLLPSSLHQIMLTSWDLHFHQARASGSSERSLLKYARAMLSLRMSNEENHDDAMI
jgi:hypothetical protein